MTMTTVQTHANGPAHTTAVKAPEKAPHTPEQEEVATIALLEAEAKLEAALAPVAAAQAHAAATRLALYELIGSERVAYKGRVFQLIKHGTKDGSTCVSFRQERQVKPRALGATKK